MELGAGSSDAVLVLKGEESREDLGVSVDVFVSVDDLELAEVDSGTLLDELGAEVVGLGIALGVLELVVGF